MSSQQGESGYLSFKWDARLVCLRYILEGDSSDVTGEAGLPVAFKNDT